MTKKYAVRAASMPRIWQRKALQDALLRAGFFWLKPGYDYLDKDIYMRCNAGPGYVPLTYSGSDYTDPKCDYITWELAMEMIDDGRITTEQLKAREYTTDNGDLLRITPRTCIEYDGGVIESDGYMHARQLLESTCSYVRLRDRTHALVKPLGLKIGRLNLTNKDLDEIERLLNE